MTQAPLLLLLTLTASAAEIRRLDNSRISTAAAESFARQTLAAAHVTGAQIAVLNQGKLVWSFAYGLRQKAPDLPMTPQTTTWAASITKSIFATYLAQLHFPLDTPVAQLLPQPLDTYEPYRATAPDLVRDPQWPRVTIRMLLAHTSGLVNFATDEPDKKMHLHTPPGAVYRYSGQGFNLAQFVVEQRQGKPLAELMDAAVFTPLQMTRTSLIFRPEFESDIADRFGTDEQFLAKTRRFPARAAGSLTTTAEDLAKFASNLLAGQFVPHKPVIAITSLHQFPTQPNEPPGQEALQVGLAYSAGWGLLTKTRFGPAFFKEGHGDGAQTYLICFQKSKSCMILLANSDNGERTFRPLLEKILGDTATPWVWEGYP